jgi:polyhydroxyalkanoate synthesis repressor PhaR
MKVIKRYSNRKLYDTQAGCYVTLDDLGDMIRSGQEIQVIDHANGTDLTTLTMLQILFEQEKQLGGMPQVMLKRLIQSGSQRLGFLRNGLRAFLDPAQSAEDEMRRRLQILVQKGMIQEDERERLENLFFARDFHQPAPVQEEEPASPADVEALLKQKVTVNLLEKIESSPSLDGELLLSPDQGLISKIPPALVP